MARMASSLPAIGKLINSGSALVSTIATVGIFRRLASATAMPSRCGVDDDDRVGQLLHVADAFEVALQLFALALHGGDFLFAHLAVFGLLLELLDVLQPADALADGREVRQRAAEPALVDVILPARLRRFLDRFLRLLLAADEEHLALRAATLLRKSVAS